jgi:hypothetical protein
MRKFGVDFPTVSGKNFSSLYSVEQDNIYEKTLCEDVACSMYKINVSDYYYCCYSMCYINTVKITHLHGHSSPFD